MVTLEFGSGSGSEQSNGKQEVKKWRILQKGAVVAISFLAASAAHRSPGTA